MAEFRDFAWELDEDVRLARANFMACAYNAAVNHGTDRGVRKMRDLVRAINYYERCEGRVKLGLLAAAGIIAGYTPCPQECEFRPGGLFHARGCENDFNHPVSRARSQRACELLPGGTDGGAGRRAASVSLVG